MHYRPPRGGSAMELRRFWSVSFLLSSAIACRSSAVLQTVNRPARRWAWSETDATAWYPGRRGLWLPVPGERSPVVPSLPRSAGRLSAEWISRPTHASGMAGKEPASRAPPMPALASARERSPAVPSLPRSAGRLSAEWISRPTHASGMAGKEPASRAPPMPALASARGTVAGGAFVTAECGQTVCGTDYKTYNCKWNGREEPASRAPPMPALASARGTVAGGAFVTAECGQTVCGGNGLQDLQLQVEWLGRTGESCTSDAGACQCEGMVAGGASFPRSAGSRSVDWMT